MKLELKRHILPYFGHGIKAITNRGEIVEINHINLVDRIYPLWAHSSGDYKTPDFNYDYLTKQGLRGKGFRDDELRFILRPLSDLYKEIDGKIGIVELAKIACPKSEWKLRDSSYFPTDSNRRLFVFYSTRNCFVIEYDTERGRGYVFVNQLDLFTYLYENHYDVFSLIPQNLAIDINQIN